MATKLNLNTLRVDERFKFAEGYNVNSNEPVNKEQIYYSKGHFKLLGYTLVRELNNTGKTSIKIYGSTIINLV